MALRLISAAATVPDEVWSAIADAKAAGTNARSMVLNRDPRLAAVEQAAASVPVTLQQADQEHVALRAYIDAKAMTPGPRGADGAQGLRGPAGVDGVQGIPGVKGDTGATGIAGTANLAVAAAPVGLLALGGSTTITMPLSRTMPNNTYSVQFAHSAVVSLANVTFSNVVKTTTTVQVKVTSVGLALAAGTLIAVVW